MPRSPSPADALDSTLARVGFVLVVAALAALAAWTRGRLPTSWPGPAEAGVTTGSGGAGIDPARTLGKVEAFLRGDPAPDGGWGGGADHLRLREAELRAVLASVLEPRLPAGVEEPSLTLGDSSLVVAAVLDVDRVLGEEGPAVLRGVLGDTARVSADLVPTMAGPGRLHLRVRRLTAGSIRVPRALLPWMLAEAGLRTSPDEPGTVEVPVDAALSGVGVRAGGLWLERREGGTD